MESFANLTDEMLVKLYAGGNNSAFDILLERYEEKIFSYIFFIVHNQDVADDIFQETFMKAVVTIQQGRYVENGKFQAWITRIAHNLIIDYFRQTRNENCVSNDEVEYDLFNDIKLAETNVESKMVREQVLDDVKLLVEHLPQNQKEVVFMRYYQELSFKEIADITDVRNMTNAQLKKIIQKIEVDKDGNVDIYLRLFGELGLDQSVLIYDFCT